MSPTMATYAVHEPEDVDEGRVALEEGIRVRDLLEGEEITFSVKNPVQLDGDPRFESAEDTFDPDKLIDSTNLEVLDGDDETHQLPFEAIKSKMTKVTSNGSVMKRVLQKGIGDAIPPDAVVYIHYNAFLEFNEVPFDSSSLRGKALELVLGSGALAGLDIAVATMKSRERSEFLLQPSVAYGAIGCPPRIPGNAEILFRIEVMKWRVGSEAVLSRALANDGQAGWSDTRKAVRSLVTEGVEFFNSHHYKDSKRRLEKAKSLLEHCTLKNDEEEEEHKKLMFKVCINLAMVFNKLTGNPAYPPSAIINCKEAIQYDPNNGKAFLQWGIALTTLGEYDKARDFLKRAKRQYPDNNAVREALERLEKMRNASEEVERDFCTKAFQTNTKLEKKEEEVSPEMQEIVDQLKSFAINSNKDSMILPAGVTPFERKAIQSAADDLSLLVDFNNTSIVITKLK